KCLCARDKYYLRVRRSVKARIIKTISRTNQAPVKAVRGHVAHGGPAHGCFSQTFGPEGKETKMTSPLDPIRRRPDGSIDFDRYRADIHAARHLAMQDASKLGAAMKLIAAFAVMLIAIALGPSSESNDASCQNCTKAGRITASQDAGVMPRLY